MDRSVCLWIPVIGNIVAVVVISFVGDLSDRIAPPGSTSVPLTIGACAFGVTVISAIAAFTARETNRVHLNDLGEPGAVAVDKVEYERLRQQSIVSAAS